MKKELDDKLCADYPEIFRDRHASMRETAMCWGFDCGDGWYPLIDQLCKTLMGQVIYLRKQLAHVSDTLAQEDKSHWKPWMFDSYTEAKLADLQNKLDAAVKEIPVAMQVKEKYGTLSFYVNTATDVQRSYIAFAESMSSRICEECGVTKDTVLYTFGWYKTLCPEHARAYYGEEADHFRNKTGEWADDAP